MENWNNDARLRCRCEITMAMQGRDNDTKLRQCEFAISIQDCGDDAKLQLQCEIAMAIRICNDAKLLCCRIAMMQNCDDNEELQ